MILKIELSWTFCLHSGPIQTQFFPHWFLIRKKNLALLTYVLDILSFQVRSAPAFLTMDPWPPFSLIAVRLRTSMPGGLRIAWAGYKEDSASALGGMGRP
jgi:hypothetical protein